MDFKWEFITLMLSKIPNLYCGSGSSGGLAADYRLDGPGSNSGGDEMFCPSRPALGPTQLPLKWVPGLSRGLKCGGRRGADHSLPSSSAVMEG